MLLENTRFLATLHVNQIFIEFSEISRLKQISKKAKQSMLRCRTNMSGYLVQHLARTLVLTKCGQL